MTIKEKEVFANKIVYALLPLTDERIAEIYLIINSWETPPELEAILMGIDRKKDTDYWRVFKKVVHEIIPQELITKTHYRNLAKENFDFRTIVFDL